MLASQGASTERHQRPALRHLVVPRLVRAAPIHKWFVFPHSFAPQLLTEILESHPLPQGAIVGDCFVGSGTVALAAKQAGHDAVAADMMPLSCLATRAKTHSYDVRSLRTALASLDPPSGNDGPARVDRFGTVTAAFGKETLDEIDGLLNQIGQLEDAQARDFFRLGLAQALQAHSALQKTGGWLKKVQPPPQDKTVRQTFRSVAAEMLDDVASTPVGTGTVCVTQSDARQLPWADSSVSLILSSPPYPNKHDYTRVFCLELAIACEMTWQQIRALRYRMLRSHVEAQEPTVDSQQVWTEVEDRIRAMGAVRDPRLPRMVRGYFRDMDHVLRELKRVVKPGGLIVLVVGDVRFAGQLLPVGDLLKQLASRAGLTDASHRTARFRGNSAQQMKTHGRVASPEWILSWTK